jgi:exopolysaccharide biosynthesis polyprenyl glycosylphosphotransferase
MSSKSPAGLMFWEESSPRAFGRERREKYTHFITAILFVGDIIWAFLALLFGYWLRFHSFLQGFGVPAGFVPKIEVYSSYFLIALVAMLGLLVFKGHYDRESFLRPRHSAFMMLEPILAWGAIFTSLSLILKLEPNISRLFVLYSMLTMVAILPLWRNLFSRHLIAPYFSKYLRNKTLVIGWNERVEELVDRSVGRGNMFPLSIASVVTTRNESNLSSFPMDVKTWRLGDDFSQIICSSNYDTVLLADSSLDDDSRLQIQQICAREMMDFMVLPNHVHALQRRLSVQLMQGIPILTQGKRSLDRLDTRIIKRMVDIFGALFGLIVFSPIIVYYAWRVKRESPGPAFYRQVRLGRNGKSFEIIKIRSMRIDAESGTGAKWCEVDDPRRLKIGAFMRRMNIDELPQFWNVLKGEMSLVGPRPERPELINDFKSQVDYYNLRHSVKTGLTGWAQVNGWRGDTDLDARIACDIEYIECAGFWFDLYIIIRTILAQKNAY